MTPPRSAFLAARRRTVAAVRAMNHGWLTYEGVEYACGVSEDGEGYELGDLGTRITQRLRASILKTLLPSRPERGKMVYLRVPSEEIAGKAYEIELVAGDGEGIPDWEITAVRVPGADL